MNADALGVPEEAGSSKKELIVKKLQAALASEKQSEYQYWWGKYTVLGPMFNSIQKEFADHEEEERAHAELLAERLYELGGMPVFNPNDLHTVADCPYPKYEEEDNQCTMVQLKQQLEAEECAIKNYEELIALTADCDPATNDVIVEILREENEHVKDLKKFIVSLEFSSGKHD